MNDNHLISLNVTKKSFKKFPFKMKIKITGKERVTYKLRLKCASTGVHESEKS